jgi:hypothetical protein
MKKVIITAALLVSMASKAQTYDNPLRISEKSTTVPGSEWFTYDGVEKFYKGETQHINEVAWIILYETDGNWHETDEDDVRVNDRKETIDINGETKTVYIWDMSDGNSLCILGELTEEQNVIFVKPTR